MPMTPEQQAKFQKWIYEKAPNFACDVCSGQQWTAGDIIMAPSFTEGGINLGGKGAPMAQAFCMKCGNAKMFSAVMIGLVK